MSIPRPAALAFLAILSGAAYGQQVSDATSVQTLPDVELEDGKYAACGIRILFSNAESADSADVFDLTVSLYVKDPVKDPVTIVRATERRGGMVKGANSANSQMLPPGDLMFAVQSLRDPIRLRDPRIGSGVFSAPVDESKAKTVGAFGGRLIREFLDGAPVLVIWMSSPDAPSAFRVKTHPNPDLTDSLEACLKGHLAVPLDPRSALP